MEASKLILFITRSFAQVRLGSGIGFFEADCVDDGLPSNDIERIRWRKEDEREDWRRIVAWIEEEPLRPRFHPFSAFIFMDGAGRRFALPCYLIWAVNDTPRAPEIDTVLNDHTLQDLPLSSAQQACVRAVLEYLIDRAWEHNDDQTYDELQLRLGLFDRYRRAV